MKLKISHFSIVLLLALFVSCCREDPVEIARIELSQDELELIPYNYSQQVNFIHSNGYEFAFSVTTDTIVWDSYSAFCEWDCCGQEYVSYQVKTTTLESAYPNLVVTISIMGYDYGNYLKFLGLDINHRHFVSMPYDSLANFVCEPRYEAVFLDSVIIRDKPYKEVIEKKFDNHYFIDDSTVLIPESILYNDLGLLQIKMSNEETFSINN